MRPRGTESTFRDIPQISVACLQDAMDIPMGKPPLSGAYRETMRA